MSKGNKSQRRRPVGLNLTLAKPLSRPTCAESETKWNKVKRTDCNLTLIWDATLVFKSRPCGPLTYTHRQICLEPTFLRSCSVGARLPQIIEAFFLLCVVLSSLLLVRVSYWVGRMRLFTPGSFAACKFAMTVFHSSILVYVGSPVVGVRTKRRRHVGIMCH